MCLSLEFNIDGSPEAIVLRLDEAARSLSCSRFYYSDRHRATAMPSMKPMDQLALKIGISWLFAFEE
jgi:hypothetical protein